MERLFMSEPLDYQFEGSINTRIKKQCDKIIKIVPELKYIEKDDFGIIIAKMKPPKKGGLTVIATMESIGGGWEIQYIEYKTGIILPPYMMMVYPNFFRYGKTEKTKILMHELFHIPEKKRGIRPHTGFGDEVIFKMHRKSLNKLKSV